MAGESRPAAGMRPVGEGGFTPSHTATSVCAGAVRTASMTEPSLLRTLFGDAATRARLFWLYGGLVGFNVVAWAWAFAEFSHQPVLIGTAFLAYVFGLRHAFDADHIAAIDNVVRKLMQAAPEAADGRLLTSRSGTPRIVVIASAVIAASAAALQGELDRFHEIGGVIGTLVSAFFLLAIGLANLFVLRGIWARLRAGEARREHRSMTISTPCSPVAASWRGSSVRVFGVVRKSWHMYPVGFLFGLGFDTATEIGLLGISATQAAAGHELFVDHGVPGAVHGRHGADRHHRQRRHGRGLWLGLRQPDPQALVQPHHHRRIGSGRALYRRRRGARASLGPAVADRAASGT